MIKFQSAFSLLEVLIILSIISILTYFAIPSYQTHIVKLRRHEAEVALFDLASRMEDYYTIKNTYEHATIGSGKNTDILESPLTNNGWYRLSIMNANANTYQLQASALNAQALLDSQCRTFIFKESTHHSYCLETGTKKNKPRRFRKS